MRTITAFGRPRVLFCLPLLILSIHLAGVQAFAPPASISTSVRSDSNNRADIVRESYFHGAIRNTKLKFSNKRQHQEEDHEDEDKEQDPLTFFMERIENADWMEIRLDATLSSCYVLCRFLIYDITSGAKDIPGWEFQDVVLLLGTFSSAIVLAVYWTAAGLVLAETSFQQDRKKRSSAFDIDPTLVETLAKVVVAAPSWLVTERILHFGPPVVLLGTDLTTELITGTLGLGSVMLLGRAVPSEWR
jgi:hypothetical protein